MDLSVLIPTRGRPGKLAACLRCLAAQEYPRDRFEVLIGVDGTDTGACADEVGSAAADAGAGLELRVIPGDRAGQAAVRNRLLPRARGRILVFLNDDMLPEPGLLSAHAAAHRERDRLGKPAIVLGDAPWVIHEPDRLFDRLIRETSMVFFYDRMPGASAWSREGAEPGTTADPDHDWGFRHAWMLNLSVPAATVRDAGGLTVFPSTYGYEDDELAYRLARRYATPVLFRPDARALHDHRYEPADYLRREFALGYAAWGFAGTAGECARAMFGRDVTAADEIAYSRAYVERERRAAENAYESFTALARMPATVVGAPGTSHARGLVRLLYEHHLPLKRWSWRRGLIAAAEGRPLDEWGFSPLPTERAV